MAITISQTQLNELTARYNAGIAAGASTLGAFSSAYTYLVGLTSGQTAGVDPNSLNWLKGAADVNRDVGASAAFIRKYTEIQYTLRYGNTLNPATLQTASNNIAKGVILDTLNSASSLGNGNYSLSIPSITRIADLDAGPIAADIFNGDRAGWAGTLLFLFLGDSSSFNQYLLVPGNPYNLLAMYAAMSATVQQLGLTQTAQGFADALFASGYSGVSLFNQWQNNAVNYINQTYGKSFNGTEIGIIPFPTLFNPIVGRYDADAILNGTTSDDFIIGGTKNDTINYSAGNNIIDGGGGTNAVSYAAAPGSIKVIMDQAGGSSTIPRSATVLLPNSLDFDSLYNIQKVIGTVFADIFSIRNPALGNTVIFEGGGGADRIDFGSNATGTLELIGQAGTGNFVSPLTGSITNRGVFNVISSGSASVTTGNFVNDGKIVLGNGATLKIGGAITSSLTPIATTDTQTVKVAGASHSVSGKNYINGSANPINWTATATVSGSPWTAHFGNINSLWKLDNLVPGSAAYNRLDYNGPTSLSTAGLPYYAQGIAVYGNTPDNPNIAEPPVTQSITYTFDTPIPAGTKFFLWDPGTLFSGTTPFQFTASVHNSGVVQQVSTAGWSFNYEEPYPWQYGLYDLPPQPTINAATGTITIYQQGYHIEIPVDMADPIGQTNVVFTATTDTAIDSITVTGQTAPFDYWGLAFVPQTPEIQMGSGSYLEVDSTDASQTISFNSSGSETLQINDPLNFNGTIKNFSIGDSIKFIKPAAATGITSVSMPGDWKEFQLTIHYNSNNTTVHIPIGRDQRFTTGTTIANFKDTIDAQGNWTRKYAGTHYYGYSGNQTLTLTGDTDDIMHIKGGIKIFDAGGGDDTVYYDAAAGVSSAGSAVNGGTGTNTLIAAGGGNFTDLSSLTLSNFQTLNVSGGQTVKVSATQWSTFTTLNGGYPTATIQFASPGTYDLAAKTIPFGVFSLAGSTGNDVLKGDATNQTLSGSDGSDSLYGFDGGDVLIGGMGADIMYGGNGDDEFLVGGTELVAGEIIDGGAGLNEVNTWNTNLSLATITNVQSLVVHLTDVTLSSAQMASFTTLLAVDGAVTLTASNAGTYSLDGKAVTGSFSMIGSAGADYLAGNGANQTLNGGEGNDIIQGVGGVDTLLGGNGNDEFLIGGTEAAAGSVVDGGAGINRISSWNVDLSGVAVSNVQMLGLNLGTAKLTAAQFAGLTTIENNSGTTATITAATAGTFTLGNKAVTGAVNLIGTTGNDYLGGNGANQTLSGGDGNDQIQGLGGVDTLLGGNGDDEFLIGGTEAATGSVVDGGAGVNKISSWNANLTGVTVSNIQSLSLNLPLVTLTAAQFSGLTTIANNSGSTGTITAASAGTYSFVGKTITGAVNLTGSSGNDTLTGNSAAQTIAGAAGNDTLDGAGGTDILQGGIGNDTYKFGLGYGSDNITDNDSTAGNTDILSFAAGTARDQIWFSQSGNDLLVRIIGTTDQMTISGWYNGSANHVEQLKTSTNNVLLDSQVQNLVNAMAGMAFPSTTTLTAQQHTQLDAVIAANWT